MHKEKIMENRPKLRDSKRLSAGAVYPLNVFPNELIKK